MTHPALSFQLSEPRPAEGRLTTADLAIKVAGESAWPVLGAEHVSLEVQVDDLLSYLTDFWKPLMLRQVFPLGLMPDRPSHLRAKAREKWAAMPAATVEAQDEIIDAFEEAHDLSRGFAGVYGLPSFWLMRSNELMICETGGRVWALDFQTARVDLTRLGDSLAARLESDPKERWGALISAWRMREEGDPANLLAWSTGLPVDMARRLMDERILAPVASVSAAANDNDELRVAARMAGALPEFQVRQIIDLARGVPKVDAQSLDALSRDVRRFVDSDFGKSRPHEQGEAAAGFVRELYGLPGDQKVDIFGLIQGLGVMVQSVEAPSPTLDGLAVWGPGHGPGVVLNKTSRRHGGWANLATHSAARVTLAHELCHLLLDKAQALSAVDVLGGRMPSQVEARAKAFAGELLLPGAVAASYWKADGGPAEPEPLSDLLNRICRRFGVTRSVASWKLEHGAEQQGWGHLHAVLNQIVPSR